MKMKKAIEERLRVMDFQERVVAALLGNKNFIELASGLADDEKLDFWRVRLSNGSVETFRIIAENNHTVPPGQTRGRHLHFSMADKRYDSLGELTASSFAKRLLLRRIAEQLPEAFVEVKIDEMSPPDYARSISKAIINAFVFYSALKKNDHTQALLERVTGCGSQKLAEI